MPSIISNIVEVSVFRLRASVPEALLLQRARDENLYPGVWQNVTGSVQDGESALGAAKRELTEETGLEPVRFWVVPYTTAFYDPRQDAIVVVPFFAAQVGLESVPSLSREHDRFAWLGLAEARDRLVWPGQRQGLEVVFKSIVGGDAASHLSEIPLR